METEIVRTTKAKYNALTHQTRKLLISKVEVKNLGDYHEILVYFPYLSDKVNKDVYSMWCTIRKFLEDNCIFKTEKMMNCQLIKKGTKHVFKVLCK